MGQATWKNVNGVWKQASNVWLNVGGVWRQNVKPWVNVGGTWKQCFPTIVLAISPTSSTWTWDQSPCGYSNAYITVTSNTSWQLVPSQDSSWVYANKWSGIGNDTITLYVDELPDPGGPGRSTLLRFTAPGHADVNYWVYQLSGLDDCP